MLCISHGVVCRVYLPTYLLYSDERIQLHPFRHASIHPSNVQCIVQVSTSHPITSRRSTSSQNASFQSFQPFFSPIHPTLFKMENHSLRTSNLLLNAFLSHLLLILLPKRPPHPTRPLRLHIFIPTNLPILRMILHQPQRPRLIPRKRRCLLRARRAVARRRAHIAAVARAATLALHPREVAGCGDLAGAGDTVCCVGVCACHWRGSEEGL